DGILLRPGQTLIQGAQVFNMVYNTQLVGNTVENVEAAANTGAPAYIGLLPYQYGVSQTLGTAAIGVEIRDNVLQGRGGAYTPSYANNNQLGMEGYYNFFLAQYIGSISTIPITLGTIFQNNTARDCSNAYYLSSGIHNTLLCSTTLRNVGKLVDDRKLANSTQASVNTVSECTAPTSGPDKSRQRPVADPKTNAPIPRNGGATRVVPLTGFAYDGVLTGFTITALPLASQGTLYLGSVPAAQNAPLSVEQGAMLSFEPRNGYTGDAVFTYTSADNQGMVSLEANFVIPVTNPLPVELTQFTAKARNADAVLTWTTASELHNRYFAVERSFDASRFQRVGTVQGAGTTATGATYSFVDANVPGLVQGPVYYRLKQVDYDSTATYSAVRALTFARSAPITLSVYPNPTVNQLHVLLPTAGARLTVYSATGLVILDTRTDTTEGALDVEQLPVGSYLLMVQPDRGAQMHHQFIKEKS
ncbi:T9SS type A sorting domain-containing protein, partial [Hymenobacter wooponensis]